MTGEQPGPRRQTRFWILWGFDALIAAVVLYFFGAGLADGRVSSFNIVLWLLILGAVGGIVGGSLWFRSREELGIAMAMVLVLAVPGCLALLFFLAVLILHPRWN